MRHSLHLADSRREPDCPATRLALLLNLDSLKHSCEHFHLLNSRRCIVVGGIAVSLYLLMGSPAQRQVKLPLVPDLGLGVNENPGRLISFFGGRQPLLDGNRLLGHQQETVAFPPKIVRAGTSDVTPTQGPRCPLFATQPGSGNEKGFPGMTRKA